MALSSQFHEHDYMEGDYMEDTWKVKASVIDYDEKEDEMRKAVTWKR